MPTNFTKIVQLTITYKDGQIERLAVVDPSQWENRMQSLLILWTAEQFYDPASMDQRVINLLHVQQMTITHFDDPDWWKREVKVSDSKPKPDYRVARGVLAVNDDDHDYNEGYDVPTWAKWVNEDGSMFISRPGASRSLNIDLDGEIRIYEHGKRIATINANNEPEGDE